MDVLSIASSLVLKSNFILMLAFDDFISDILSSQVISNLHIHLLVYFHKRIYNCSSLLLFFIKLQNHETIVKGQAGAGDCRSLSTENHLQEWYSSCYLSHRT